MNVTRCSRSAKLLDPMGDKVKQTVPSNERRIYLAASIALGMVTLGIPHGIYAWKKQHKVTVAAPSDTAIAATTQEAHIASLAGAFALQAEDIRQLLQHGVIEDLLQDYQSKTGETPEAPPFCSVMNFLYGLVQSLKSPLAINSSDKVTAEDLNFAFDDSQMLQDRLKSFATAEDQDALAENLEFLAGCMGDNYIDHLAFFSVCEKIIDILGPALLREARQPYFKSTL